MTDYDDICNPKNLTRAYRWILSNPEARYKNLFRDSYSAYAASSLRNLQRLRKDLVAHRFEPNHASKLFLPKASGLLRPYSLLTMDDQIVYQACINLIADKLKPRTKTRYRKTVFNHLYAGRTSRFFYMRWQNSYRLFTRAFIARVNSGYSYVANFDLTSFYDSIDHNVLRHFLSQIGFDADFMDFLMRCLRVWTSSTWANRPHAIYHNHGIPQGPLSSGMLSEVVLQYLDQIAERGKQTKYLRYVDDIKFLARNETQLRQKLIALDIAAREVGLFPQTAKVNIRHVIDPYTEIKSISIPPEPALRQPADQARIRARLISLVTAGRVEDGMITRFRFLLARATPSHKLNLRLIKVLANQPEYAESISAYFSRYKRLPKKAAELLVAYLHQPELYHSVRGELLRAIIDNVQGKERTDILDFCYHRLFALTRWTKHLPPPQPTYKEALIAWLIRHQRITYAELVRLRNAESDWWVRKSIIRELRSDLYGPASFESFLNECIRHKEGEMARSAAAAMIANSVRVNSPYGDAHVAAKIPLRAAGIIRRVGPSASLIAEVLEYVLKHTNSGYDWERLLGKGLHRHAEMMAVLIKQNFETNIDACLMQLDSLCDLIFEIVVNRLTPGSGYKYGSILRSPNAIFITTVPNLLAGFKALHDLRLQSITAHPRSQRTGTPTRRLRHLDYWNVRSAVRDAFAELEAQIAP